MTRRGFLGLLAVAVVPATAATRRGRWVSVPAGFTGGLTSGFAPRQKKAVGP